MHLAPDRPRRAFRLAAALAVASALLALWPAPAAAERSIKVSKEANTRTHFVWVSMERNPKKILFLVIQNGGTRYGTDVPDEIDVTFAKSEAGQIRWCSYVSNESGMDNRKCKPDQPLKPGGEIRIR